LSRIKDDFKVMCERDPDFHRVTPAAAEAPVVRRADHRPHPARSATVIAAARAAAYPLPRRPSPGAESLRRRLERSARAISWISYGPPVSAFGCFWFCWAINPFAKLGASMGFSRIGPTAPCGLDNF